jgi:hypothetical protein
MRALAILLLDVVACMALYVAGAVLQGWLQAPVFLTPLFMAPVFLYFQFRGAIEISLLNFGVMWLIVLAMHFIPRWATELIFAVIALVYGIRRHFFADTSSDQCEEPAEEAAQ